MRMSSHENMFLCVYIYNTNTRMYTTYVCIYIYVYIYVYIYIYIYTYVYTYAQMIRALVEQIGTLRPAPRTEFRGGSCCGSQIGWRGHIYNFLQGYVKHILRHPFP